MPDNDQAVPGEAEVQDAVLDGGETGGDGQGEVRAAEDPYKDKTADDLRAMLKAEQEKARHFQSIGDQRYAELQKLSGSVATLQSQLTDLATRKPSADPQADAKARESLYEQWGEELNPDDPEAGARLARMIDKIGGQWDARVRTEQERRESALREQIRALDPEYRERKETVDLLVENGMAMDKAIALAKTLTQSKKPAQPGAVAAPGHTSDAGPARRARAVPAWEPDAATREMWRVAGFTAEQQGQMVKDIAARMAADARA